ncbi:hypothetical protein BJY52DRAFT_1129545 [Lactarius psammicola]|nr:hypothetical protein BJY52DRAFT_1129545 [Lactarius psammicola]
MPWSESILEQFQLVDCFTTNESDYYGPYNSLLSSLFPHVEHFQVAPLFDGPFIPGSVDPTVIYIVKKRNVPVFFIKVRPYVHLQSPGKREDADEQMRRMCLDLVLGTFLIPKLYGVSAMGTCLSIYECTMATGIFPRAIKPDPNIVNDISPQERWNYDLLEASGEEKLRAIVAEVKAMAHNIAVSPPDELSSH